MQIKEGFMINVRRGNLARVSVDRWAGKEVPVVKPSQRERVPEKVEDLLLRNGLWNASLI